MIDILRKITLRAAAVLTVRQVKGIYSDSQSMNNHAFAHITD